ncbi:MAG TPA: serine/threonine-protein kinase, partial [Isosphaeraceae bacterium]|nr:serine/threonine-protein kinase [Isosphaeraceae bacterium]
MATSLESNPPSKDNPPTEGSGSAVPAQNSGAGSRTGGSSRPKSPSSTPAKSPGASGARDARGLSAIDEMNIERSIIARGLVTPQELEACKKLKPKHPGKSLLEILVGTNVLTKNQALRLQKEHIDSSSGKIEVPGYQILERLGKGSMGVVYKAKQTSVDRVVAIKVLLDSLAQNKEFIKRFEREAKIAAKLSHNNIVNAIDAGQVSGHRFFVMEYIEGETIKDLLDKGKIFEEKEALEIVLKVAEALKHAHERGLIHRDIKPENIILTKDGNVKLADLGLARPIGD